MINSKDIFNEFKKLSSPTDEKAGFTVVAISGTLHKLGISPEGYTKFFISTNDTTSETPNKLLNILTVEYNLSCTLVDEDKNSQHNYTVITLLSTEPSLQEYFISIVVMVLQRLSPVPSKEEIAQQVEQLISIFSKMIYPPKKRIQGLWAELLVIEKSYNPEVLINAWHQSPSAKYDFTMGRDKLEVKSTSSETRSHHFTLDQLVPTNNSRVLVASAIVRESASSEEGLSVSDLCNKIFERVDSMDAHIHVMNVIAETIGDDLKKMNDVCFDYIEASDTLKFYDSNDIPRVAKESVQPSVSGVGFNSDLSGVIDVRLKRPEYDRGKSLLYNSLYE